MYVLNAYIKTIQGNFQNFQKAYVQMHKWKYGKSYLIYFKQDLHNTSLHHEFSIVLM